MTERKDLNPLEGIRVLEFGDEKVEFTGLLLAGGGAEVIKIESPSGVRTRTYGPFLENHQVLSQSLYHWHYNHGKKSVVLDLDSTAGIDTFRALVKSCDVLLDGSGRDSLTSRGLSYEELAVHNTGLIVCSTTDFGTEGPWRDFQASDLIHLALGGQVMLCGYSPVGDYDLTNPRAHYDTPPVAPQMWHAYHTAGVHGAIAVYAALIWREATGLGQLIENPIHTGLAVCTEGAPISWIYFKKDVFRQTGTHAAPTIQLSWQLEAADGNYINAPMLGTLWPRLVALLESEGLAGSDIEELAPKQGDLGLGSGNAETTTRLMELVHVLMSLYSAEEVVRRAQAAGLPWTLIRRPEELPDDPHFRARNVFNEVDHPELGRTLRYGMIPWQSNEMPWVTCQRAPLLGEHTAEVLDGRRE